MKARRARPTVMTDELIFADRKGVIRRWTAAAEALFGYTQAEALGKSLDLIIPEHLRAAHWRGYDAAIASGRTRLNEKPMRTRAVHKDGGKVYLDMAFSLVKDEKGEVLGALASVTGPARPAPGSRGSP
jgi:PAS domain S-box-containing protein